MPVQARSVATVQAIRDAALQVLIAEGLARCTTTRVAERAGVSVGSIYQYYPNGKSMLGDLLAQYLDHLATAVEDACAGCHGLPIDEMASTLVGAMLDAKLAQMAASKALYAVIEAHGGGPLLGRARTRMGKAASAMLATAADAHFEAVDTVSLVALSAIAGPLRAILESEGPARSRQEFRAELKDHVILLARAYLREAASAPQGGQVTFQGHKSPSVKRNPTCTSASRVT